jgi:hypothetical protein
METNFTYCDRTDVGTIWKPFPRLVNSALWYLYLQQEFVYVGDAESLNLAEKQEEWELI